MNDYLSRVRELPCVICDAFGENQISNTTAHHCFHGRYSQAKAIDLHAIPLCDGHHQGQRDTSKLAIHQHKYAWAERYGADTDFILVTQDRIFK